MESVSTKDAPAAMGPYSQAVKASGFVFCSGQLPLRSDGLLEDASIETQTQQVLQNLTSVLKAAGSDISKVLKTTVYLSDMNHFAAMNEVYGNFFGSHKPARATVGVARLPKDALIEIDCIAQVD